MQHWYSGANIEVSSCLARPKALPWTKWIRNVSLPNILKRFVMMSVHISHEEVDNRHINDVQQSSSPIIWRRGSYQVTVVRVHFPLSLSSFVVGTSPRMPPHFPSCRFYNPTKTRQFSPHFLYKIRSIPLGGKNAANDPSSMSGLPHIAWLVSQ